MTDSLSQSLEQHALRAASVEFAVVDALPRSEVEFAIGDGHEHLMAEQHPLEVRVRVVFARLMMPIVESMRRELLEPLHDVVPEPGLMVVDEDARGDVHRTHEDEAVAQPRARAHFFYAVGDVDDLVTVFRVERDVFGM